MDGTGPQSTAGTAGHNALPLLMPFPIAFLTTAFMSDLAFWTTGASMWATASLWLLGANMVALPIAAIIGFTSSAGDPRIRGSATRRQIASLLAVALTLFNWYPRYKYAAPAGILPFGIWISLATFSMLMFGGWLGPKLVAAVALQLRGFLGLFMPETNRRFPVTDGLARNARHDGRWRPRTPMEPSNATGVGLSPGFQQGTKHASQENRRT